MVAGLPEYPFILASIMTQWEQGIMALVWVSKPYTRQQGVAMLGTGCEAEVCKWWPLPMLLTGEEIPEHQDVGPGDILRGSAWGTEALRGCRCARDRYREGSEAGLAPLSLMSAVSDLTDLFILLSRWRSVGKSSSSFGCELSQDLHLALLFPG